MWEIILAMGIPTAITGVIAWYLKKKIQQQEERQLEREQNREQLMLMIMQNSRANSVLCKAIACAVQRIPDAHCNGDMTKALEFMDTVQREEKDFLINLGIKHIYED